MPRAWKAPYRPNNTVTQMFNDGLVSLYTVTADGDAAGLRPEATETLAVTLSFAERRMGLQRYAELTPKFDRVERVVRVPKCPKDAVLFDVAVIGSARYRVALAQEVPDVYPPCLDLTLARLPGTAQVITVYNIREDPLTFARTVSITMVTGALLSATQGAAAAAGQMRESGSMTLQLPGRAEAEDALTGAPRVWAGPREYANADDRGGLFTLDPNKDFIVKGRVVEPTATLQSLAAEYDGVYRVTKFTAAGVGAPALWTLEAGGA